MSTTSEPSGQHEHAEPRSRLIEAIQRGETFRYHPFEGNWWKFPLDEAAGTFEFMYMVRHVHDRWHPILTYSEHTKEWMHHASEDDEDYIAIIQAVAPSARPISAGDYMMIWQLGTIKAAAHRLTSQDEVVFDKDGSGIPLHGTYSRGTR